MTYKYSICYPDRKEIEYKNNLISANEALVIAKNHPWIEQLELLKNLNQDKICYNPSIDYSSTKNRKSFCLTANYNDDNKLEFSLWYNRPKKIKVLFGLLGEKEKMIVDDIWKIDFEKAIKYLEYFLNEKYDIIENLY
jgi:hypothetical protein